MDAAADSVTSEELAPDSMEIATVDSLEQDSKILAAGAMETTTEDGLEQQSLLPESQPALCVRCGTTHDDNDVEGCRLARRLTSRHRRSLFRATVSSPRPSTDQQFMFDICICSRSCRKDGSLYLLRAHYSCISAWLHACIFSYAF
jgi:hypothetical protein